MMDDSLVDTMINRGLVNVVINRGKELRAMFHRSRRKCIIYFYEWSDLSRRPLIFNSVLSFLDFCKGCNIGYTTESLYSFECDVMFASCAYGSPSLVLAESYPLLREKMDGAK